MLKEWDISHSWWDWKNDSLYQSCYNLIDIKNNSHIFLERYVYSWSQEINENFLICYCRYINKSEQIYYNSFIGFYLDINMSNLNHQDDMVGYIDSLRLAYMYDPEDSVGFIGVKILSEEPNFGVHYLRPEYIPFEDSYYYMLLSSMPQPGYMPDTAGDYSVWLSAGSFTHYDQDTIDITYGIVASENFQDFINNTIRMQQLYDSIDLAVEEEVIIYKPSLLISPNPTCGIVNLNFQYLTDQIADIEIYNIDGRLLRIERIDNINNNKLDLSYLNSGIYFLKIILNTSNYHEKMIIIR